MSEKTSIIRKLSNQGHILVSIGAAVGIANLVLFPARVHNYGGLAFILVFVLCTLIIGVPLMIAETALGKLGQTDAVDVFDKIGGGSWKFVGFLGILTNAMVLTFYVIVSGWALYYWFLYLFDYEVISSAITEAKNEGKPSVAGVGHFFGSFVTSPRQVILLAAAYMAITTFIVANNIKAGLEWVSRHFIPFLALLIVGLIIVLPFVGGDLIDYSNFTFDLKPLFSLDSSGRIGIIEAVGQSFFSLALGACAMVTFGSHIDRKTDVVKNSHFIVHSDTLVALLGALLLIPLISSTKSVGADPSLVFITLVDTFHNFSAPFDRIVGVVFFTLFNFAIITSTMAMMEPSVNYLVKSRGLTRKRSALIIGTFIFIFCIPGILSFSPNSSSFFTNFLGYGNRGDGTMGYFNFILDFFGTFSLLVGAFLFSVFLWTRWSIDDLVDELSIGGHIVSSGLKRFLKVSLLWVTPIFMILLFIGEIIKLKFKLGL